MPRVRYGIEESQILFISESGQCPECDMVLKRAKFRTQIFEDPLVEKEIDIRRRVSICKKKPRVIQQQYNCS